MQLAPGPIKLFRDHDPHQRMGQGQPRQGPELGGAGAAGGVQTVWTANQQADIAALPQPPGQMFRQFSGAPWLAAFIQRNEAGVGWSRRQQSFAFSADNAGKVRVCACLLYTSRCV